MQSALPSFGRFWSYNYRIVAGSGYWILAVPVALSQVVTLWMMALASDFSQESANRIGEMMTPVLSAFLVAHSLAPEYRSGAGAVLACKPVSLSRVLAMRAMLGMLFALLLSLVTLTVCSVGLKPVDVWRPLAASLPSLWFLSTLALLFATIFRNPLGGFGVALALWGLDLALGYGVHPLLSSQGFSTAAEGDALAKLWPYGKAVQVVAGCLLWAAHGTQLPRLCRAPEQRDVVRLTVVCALVLAAYCVSGAATVVGYAYALRGNLDTRDVIWIRRYLRVYGPVPVARLFGPAFHTYVSEPPPARRGADDKSARIQQLEQAAKRWPRSMWADGIDFELAMEKEAVEPENAALSYVAVADRHGASPFAPKALAAVLRLEGTAPDDLRLLAARRLIADYPRTRQAEDGAEVLEMYHPETVRPEELLKAAQAAEGVAPAHRRWRWLVTQAELELGLGRLREAGEHAEAARAGARKLEAESRGMTDRAMELRPYQSQLASVAQAAERVIEQVKQRGG